MALIYLKETRQIVLDGPGHRRWTVVHGSLEDAQGLVTPSVRLTRIRAVAAAKPRHVIWRQDHLGIAGTLDRLL